MTIEIDGDDILFSGTKVGKIEGGWPSLRQKFTECIDGLTEDVWDSTARIRSLEAEVDHDDVTISELRARIDELEDRPAEI